MAGEAGAATQVHGRRGDDRHAAARRAAAERLRSFELMADMTLVFIRCGDVERPVLKVVERPDQVVIIIRCEQDEHLTLHRKADGTVMFTHWSSDKPRGAWDRARVEAARKLGWQNPDKHAHYYSHRPLFPAPIEGMDGHELVSRRIQLEAAPTRAKYARKPRIVVEAPAREFMLSFHLSTREQPYSAPDAPHVATSFGELYFRPNT
jgi:hypothetical protein